MFSINLKIANYTNMATKIKILIFAVIIINLFCKKRFEKSNSPFPVENYRKEEKIDSTHKKIISISNFFQNLYKNRNLTKNFNINDFKYKISKKSNGTFFLQCEGRISGQTFRYAIHSKSNFDEPLLMNFENKNYLSSTFEIYKKKFNLDSIFIEPYETTSERRLNMPLTIMNIGKNFSFSFANKNYIAIEALPPCNGRYCREHYLLLIENDHTKTELIPIIFNAYYPFTFENIFLGDWNNDGTLDLFCVYYSMDETFVAKPYSLVNGHLKSIPFSKDEDFYLQYSCERCSGEMTDSLVILKHTIPL